MILGRPSAWSPVAPDWVTVPAVGSGGHDGGGGVGTMRAVVMARRDDGFGPTGRWQSRRRALLLHFQARGRQIAVEFIVPLPKGTTWGRTAAG